MTLPSIIVTILATPQEVLWHPSTWNGAYIGNVPFTAFLLIGRYVYNVSVRSILTSGRLCWFAGIGRKTYYYSVSQRPKAH
jgi:hypothetical protein